MTFEELGLDPRLVMALEKEKISVPTEIQILSLPLIQQGKDVIVQSGTGTGKTLAYLLPLFERYKADLSRESSVLILAPTHEMVVQIKREADALAQASGFAFSALALVGEASLARQLEKLKKKPRILVGSAGRILELFRMRKINGQSIRTLVLDEGDRLLDDHNREAVLSVVNAMRRDRQIVLVSASFSGETLALAGKHFPAAVKASADAAEKIPEGITHFAVAVEQRDKIETLRKILRILDAPKVLVFLNKPDQAERLNEKLLFHGIRSGMLHGTEEKSERKKAMDDFREGRIPVLIASDLAARGLQFDEVSLVVQMDIPEEPRDYLHRAGRTGRMGKPGTVLSLFTAYESVFLNKAEKVLGLRFQHRLVSHGSLLPCPDGSPDQDAGVSSSGLQDP